MSVVRGKFFIASVTLFPGGSGSSGGSVVMRPVSRGARNAEWSAATPSGEINMTITNPSAFKVFLDAISDGEIPEFFVDFTRSAVPKPGDGHPFVDSPTNHYNANKCADCGESKTAHETSNG